MMRTASPCLLVSFLGLFALVPGCDSQGNGSADTPDGSTNSDGGNGTDGGANPDGSNSSCTPEASFTGAPITGSPNQWQWIDVPAAKCRNGGSTGFGVRLNPASDKLYIYLEGGGACFNALTCGANTGAYAATDFQSWQTASGASGIFDSNNAANPVRDWNAVFIPYCTGDVHSGVATGVNVPGLGPSNQSFIGLFA